jgi:hypothetical protein
MDVLQNPKKATWKKFQMAKKLTMKANLRNMKQCSIHSKRRNSNEYKKAK